MTNLNLLFNDGCVRAIELEPTPWRVKPLEDPIPKGIPTARC